MPVSDGWWRLTPIWEPTQTPSPLRLGARRAGIPVRTLLRLIEAGRLRPIRVPGMGRLLLDRFDLDALLESSKDVAR